MTKTHDIWFVLIINYRSLHMFYPRKEDENAMAPREGVVSGTVEVVCTCITYNSLTPAAEFIEHVMRCV